MCSVESCPIPIIVPQSITNEQKIKLSHVKYALNTQLYNIIKLRERENSEQ
jgi:hypothetical protein